MKPRALAPVCIFALCSSSLADTSPSTTTDPYFESHLPGVFVESILTVDDGTVPKTGGGTTRLVGIPDGIGAYELDSEPGFFYLLVNHEINDTQGIVRDHGQIGSFVSKWKVDKITHEVVEGDDLIKNTFDWDEGSGSFVANPMTFNRMCSADLPPRTATFNSATGKGSSELLYLNGEETFGGKAYCHVVSGADAGSSYHLSHMGFAAFENVLASPFEQDKTVVVLTDDASDGEVYVYIGEKQSAGTEPEKAGFVGGNLYALAVVGKPFEEANVIADAVGRIEPFVLKLIGEPGNRPVDGTDTEARGADTVTPVDPAQAFESLKMGGPEDGAWDTRVGFENTFYFATKGTSSDGLTAVTRLWKLEFDDITNPEAGGTMTRLLDGPESRLGSFDNMDFEIIEGDPKLYIQEDLGGDPRQSKIWEYDIPTGQIEEIAEHTERFVEGGAGFLTENEESSGVLSLKEILGEGWFAASVQVHTNAGLSDPVELVEHGQLILFNIAGRGTDAIRERLVASGDLWDFRADGIDPGVGWNDVGFVIDADWNKATDGTMLGASPTPAGYGEAPGVLATDLVQPDSPRPAVTYFRKEFDVADPNGVVLFDIFAKVDDGGVFYINGSEVARINMPNDINVGASTYSGINAAGERDWKYIPVTCDGVALQSTGNVFAVSVHQDSATSSDVRFDAELILWNATPDPGAAPSQPANLATANPTVNSLELSWDPVPQANFIRIERQLVGDLAWQVIAEVPGTFVGYLDEGLLSGTAYNYRASAFNIHGGSICSLAATGTTEASLLSVIAEEAFEVENSFGIFTSVNLGVPDAEFQWVLWDFGSTGAAQGNGFGASGATEDWLITTDPINFEFFRNEVVSLDTQISFSGPDAELLYSTDYDPATGDPNTATWSLITPLNTPSSGLTPMGPLRHIADSFARLHRDQVHQPRWGWRPKHPVHHR